MEGFVKIKNGPNPFETNFRSYSDCVAVKSTNVKDDKTIDKDGETCFVAI